MMRSCTSADWARALGIAVTIPSAIAVRCRVRAAVKAEPDWIIVAEHRRFIGCTMAAIKLRAEAGIYRDRSGKQDEGMALVPC